MSFSMPENPMKPMNCRGTCIVIRPWGSCFCSVGMSLAHAAAPSSSPDLEKREKKGRDPGGDVRLWGRGGGSTLAAAQRRPARRTRGIPEVL